nr:putative ribonuclease H-like domain-containing protein [Tanacetum cinerariifolium]
MHNDIMAAGSRDRPPMLATGRYPQWRSRFLRYIDTRPNGEALRKCILSGPYKTTTVLVQAVAAIDDSPAIPEHTTVETPMNMSPTNKAHFKAEKEAIHLILSGIGDEIYSTVDACQIAQEMWEAIERLQQEWLRFVTIVKQQHKLDEVSYHKLFDILKQYQKEVNELRAKRLARNANPLALFGQFRNQRTINVAGARENIGSPVVKQSGIQCFNCKEFRHFAKEYRKPKRVKDFAYHKEKMFLCKQAKQGVTLQAEQYDWLADTNEEINEDELEAHYITATWQRFRSNTCLVETNDSNVIPDSPNMCKDDIQNDQNDERVALAKLIANLKLDTEFKKYKAFNDHTIDYAKLERKLNETLGKLAQKDIEIKEGLKTKAYQISVVKEKHDELIKHSLLTKSHYEGLVKQKTKKYPNEVNELRAEKLARNANPLALVATAQASQDLFYQSSRSHRSSAPSPKPSIPTRSHTTTRHKGKEITKPITPPSEIASEEDSDPKQFGTQRTVNVDAARENVGCKVVQQSGIQFFNCKEYGHFAKECRKSKRVKDSAYHKKKMLLCKQAEQGVLLQAEQYDWLVDTDEEVDEQELEAHYSYMAKIQEVPTADLVSNTCLVETDDNNVISDSPDMCEDDIKNEQNDVESDDELALQTKQAEFKKFKAFNDRTIDYDKLELCNEKASNAFRKEREQYFEIQDLKAQLQDKNIAISELKKLIEKGKGKSVETKFDRPSVVRQPNAQRIPKPPVLCKPTPFSDSLERKYFPKTKLVSKTNVSEGLSKPVTAQTLPQTAKKAVSNTNVLKPGMYRIDNRITHTRAPQLPQTVRNTNPRVSTSTGVNNKPNVSRPQLKSNQSRDKVLPNNSQVKAKKTQVEVYPMIPSVSNKMQSVTACKDSLNSRTLNANAVCATCNKCFVDSNHFACVTKMLNDVHARTKKPTVNGVVERRNRTLVEDARTILSASQLPLFFWAEAIATVCYTQN